MCQLPVSTAMLHWTEQIQVEYLDLALLLATLLYEDSELSVQRSAALLPPFSINTYGFP